jgi:PAS domain S-box-containing protein
MLKEPKKKSFDEKTKDKCSFSRGDGRYKTLFEQVNAATFLTTLDGKIIEANLKACELLGYEWDEFMHMSLRDILSESTDWYQIIDEISARGGINFETENIRKDKTCFPADISTSLFTMDGKPVMLALIRDISKRKKAEQTLKASEERYRTIFDNSAVAIMLTDDKERIISWNQYAERLLGMGKDELYLKKVESLYPPEEWQKIRSERIREKGMQHHLETRMYRKNNDLLDIDISLSVFKDDNGSFVGAIGVIKDITDQKKTEKKLMESEQKYRGLFECTTDGIIVLDARGEILDVNNRSLDLFDSKREDIIGKNFLNLGLLTGGSLSVIVKQFEELLSDRIATSHETDIVDKNGNVFNIELSSFFLFEKDNEIDNFVVIIRDISDRKEAEIKLSRQHGMLQTLLDNIPDSIYFKDVENKFIMVNKAKAAHSNVNPEEMVGKTDFDFLPEAQAKKAFEDDEEILSTGKFIINKVEKITHVDGTERWVSVTKAPRFDSDGNIIGTAGISRDITKWKKLEQMYENNQKQ